MKNPLCPYKYMLGQPGKGIHSYRLFNFAIADVIMTIIGAIFIAYFTNNLNRFPYILGGLFLLGIILHRLFCVRTTVDKILFPNIKDE
jgi:hypothetical protein|uniref:RDD domain-containing protein n=1 Tax=viral metagenome TaxID=1070528 RepID=A0A6C0ASY0_9ZZZZ